MAKKDGPLAILIIIGLILTFIAEFWIYLLSAAGVFLIFYLIRMFLENKEKNELLAEQEERSIRLIEEEKRIMAVKLTEQEISRINLIEEEIEKKVNRFYTFNSNLIQNSSNKIINKHQEIYIAIADKAISASSNNNDFQNEALNKHQEAEHILHQLENILNINYQETKLCLWEKLMGRSGFNEQNPKSIFYTTLSKIEQLEEPKYLNYKDIYNFTNVEDDISTIAYDDNLLMIPEKYKTLISEENQDKLYDVWYRGNEKRETANSKIRQEFLTAADEIKLINKNLSKEFDALEKVWESRKIEFFNNQEKNNNQVLDLKKKYLNREKDAIIYYSRNILESITYIEKATMDVDIEYTNENKCLIVEYLLPSFEYFPNVKEVKYIKTKNQFKEVLIPERELKKLFDSTIYKITLRSISELFVNDKIDLVESIIFNGWINSINTATGNTDLKCILSLQVNKAEFLKINLLSVDAKTCFKGLKGISGSTLIDMSPIQPIQQIIKDDRRFVPSRNISIDTSTNIAAMDWEDFEHLIREIFEKEFKKGGGEVNVTQASRDGGVDAIAFDPDPIRGGKIVIQAKRYTNVVGVSAVRDLYGTILNEGATKGILVTTADFGSDSYKFAKGKPITLLNGGNLLHLLRKHGYNAKIDILDAKKMLNDNL